MSGNDLFLAFYIGIPIVMSIVTIPAILLYGRWAQKHAPPPSNQKPPGAE